MTAQAITLGPFTKGITDSNLADVNSPNTALDIVNFDPMIDGSLVSRRVQSTNLIVFDSETIQNTPIGYFQDPTLGLYIFFNTPSGIYYWNKTSSFGGYWFSTLVSSSTKTIEVAVLPLTISFNVCTPTCSFSIIIVFI